MADIRVKPTKRTPLWVWLIAVLLLAAAGVALYMYWPSRTPAVLSLIPF